jgi:hypothetical protein
MYRPAGLTLDFLKPEFAVHEAQFSGEHQKLVLPFFRGIDLVGRILVEKFVELNLIGFVAVHGFRLSPMLADTRHLNGKYIRFACPNAHDSLFLSAGHPAYITFFCHESCMAFKSIELQLEKLICKFF